MAKIEDLIRDQTEAMRREIIEFWRIYGRSYRTSVERYRKLLERVKKIGVPSEYIHPLKKDVLKHYPKIPVLDIEDYDELREYLNNAALKSLPEIVQDIEWLPYNYSYNTVVSKICDLQGLISLYESGGKKSEQPPCEQWLPRNFQSGKTKPRPVPYNSN